MMIRVWPNNRGAFIAIASSCYWVKLLIHIDTHTHLMFNSQCHSHLLDSANTMDLFLPIWTPLLIPLGMKWIQWLWLDQFFYYLFPYPSSWLFLVSINHSFFIFKFGFACTLFYIYSSFYMFQNAINKWRIKE